MEILDRKILSNNRVSTTYQTSDNTVVEVTSTFDTSKSLAEVLLLALEGEMIAKVGSLE